MISIQPVGSGQNPIAIAISFSPANPIQPQNRGDCGKFWLANRAEPKVTPLVHKKGHNGKLRESSTCRGRDSPMACFSPRQLPKGAACSPQRLTYHRKQALHSCIKVHVICIRRQALKHGYGVTFYGDRILPIVLSDQFLRHTDRLIRCSRNRNCCTTSSSIAEIDFRSLGEEGNEWPKLPNAFRIPQHLTCNR